MCDCLNEHCYTCQQQLDNSLSQLDIDKLFVTRHLEYVENTSKAKTVNNVIYIDFNKISN